MPVCRGRRGKFVRCSARSRGHGDYGKIRRRRRSYTRRYRGYGAPMEVYSGFGRLGIGMDAFLPPLVGGGTALGTTLLLRAFVSPEVKENGVVQTEVVDGQTVTKLSWAFKYAGFIGAGAGILTSAILGPFTGWGSAVAGGITSLAAGLTGGLYNKVVPKESQGYRGYGRVFLQQRPRPLAGLGRMSMRGVRGLGMIGVQQAGQDGRRFYLPGRGAAGFPANVTSAVNMSAFGGSPTLGTSV